MVLDGGTASQQREQADAASMARSVLELLADTTLKPKAKAKALAELSGMPSREVYDCLQRIQKVSDNRA